MLKAYKQIFALSGGLAGRILSKACVGIRRAGVLAFAFSGGLAVTYSSASYTGRRRAGAMLTSPETRQRLAV